MCRLFKHLIIIFNINFLGVQTKVDDLTIVLARLTRPNYKYTFFPYLNTLHTLINAGLQVHSSLPANCNWDAAPTLALAANLFVVFANPLADALQLGNGLCALPEFSRRSSVLFPGHRGTGSRLSCRWCSRSRSARCTGRSRHCSTNTQRSSPLPQNL